MSATKVAPPIIVMLVVLAIGTVVHGIMTDRFGMVRSKKLESFAARLQRVPTTIGDWESVDAKIDAEQIERANVAGHLSRTYRHRETGAAVNMFLVCGTSRHITLHTPDLCYRAAGFDREGEIQSRNVDAGLPAPVEFASGRFYKEQGQSMQYLEIMWSFSGDGRWYGPRWARSSLAGRSALYKIYLIAPQTDRQRNPSEEGVVTEFARTAMPAVQQALFAEN